MPPRSLQGQPKECTQDAFVLPTCHFLREEQPITMASCLGCLSQCCALQDEGTWPHWPTESKTCQTDQSRQLLQQESGRSPAVLDYGYGGCLDVIQLNRPVHNPTPTVQAAQSCLIEACKTGPSFPNPCCLRKSTGAMAMWHIRSY